MAHPGLLAGDRLVRTWNWTLILCTYGLAVFGSLTTVILLDQLRMTHVRWRRQRLLILSTVALGGTSLWGMHSLGMYSMVVTCPDGVVCELGVKPWASAAGCLLVLVFCFIGLKTATKDQYFAVTEQQRIDLLADTMKQKSLRHMSNKKLVSFKALFAHLQFLLAGGVLTSVGVMLLHYIGTAFMVVNAHMSYNYYIVALSIVISIILCTAGYWICMRLLPWKPYLKGLRYLAALIIGLAVCVVHFVGLLAMEFRYLGPGHTVPDPNLGTVAAIAAAIGVTICTFSLCDVIAYLRNSNMDTRKEVDNMYKQLSALLKQPSIESDPVRFAAWITNIYLFLDRRKSVDVIGMGERTAWIEAIEIKVRQPLADMREAGAAGRRSPRQTRPPHTAPHAATPAPIQTHTNPPLADTVSMDRIVNQVSGMPSAIKLPVDGVLKARPAEGRRSTQSRRSASERPADPGSANASLSATSRLLDLLGVEPGRQQTGPLIGDEYFPCPGDPGDGAAGPMTYVQDFDQCGGDQRPHKNASPRVYPV